MALIFKIAVSSCFCFLLLKGFYDLIFQLYPNHCEMTYMYQYPEYIEIPVNKSTLSTHLPYKLYVYGEGIYAESLRNEEFRGLPVLFIPGNGGSYKQVRSAASVALRKSVDIRNKVQFNFFTADFNEELSALSGHLLQTETEYVKLCIGKILSLYEGAGLKRSVVLIGHSLGGMVAMGSAVDQFLGDRTSLIINFASPLSRPVFAIDYKLDTYYREVISYWEKERHNVLKHITVVSIGAGRNDFQVPTFLTSSNLVDIDTSTLSVPSCWLTTDHRAIVWCKQLVLATVRALFDSVDATLKSVNDDKTVVKAAFEYHLVKRSRSKRGFKRKFLKNVTAMPNKGDWSVVDRRQKRLVFDRQETDSFTVIPIQDDNPHNRHLAIVGREFDWDDWVFACKIQSTPNGSKKCIDGENLSYRSVRIPGSRKEVNIDSKSVFRKGFDYVVVWAKRSDDKVTLDVDVSNGLSRSQQVNAPVLISHFFPTLVTEATPFQASTYNVSITGITESWQSYVLNVAELHRCASANKMPIVQVRPSWKTRWEVVLSSGSSKSEFIIEVDPPHQKKPDNSTVDVHIILEPSCTYNISLQTNPAGVFKRVSLIYGPQIPAYMACHLLLALANQIKVVSQTNSCPSIFSSLLSLSPLSIVPFVTLLDMVFSTFKIGTDIHLMSRFGIEVGFFPIFLFFGTFPITLLATALVWIAVVVWGKVAYYFAERFLKRSLGVGEIAADVVMYGIKRFPFIFAVALVAIAMAVSSSLALVLAFQYYFLKMFKLYEDYLEKSVIRLIRRPSSQSLVKDLSSINLNFTLMMLVLLVLLAVALTSPGLLDSLIQGQINRVHDPFLVATAGILISFGFIWQIKLCQPSVWYRNLGIYVQTMAISAILFGSISTHHIIIVITLGIIGVAIQQVVANSTNDHSPSMADRNVTDESTQDMDHDGDELPDTPLDLKEKPVDDAHESSHSELSDSILSCSEASKSHATNSGASKSLSTHNEESKSLPTHSDETKSSPSNSDSSESSPMYGDSEGSSIDGDSNCSTDADDDFSEPSTNGNGRNPTSYSGGMVR